MPALLLNGLLGALFALVVWVVQRRTQRPELMHVLWILVLVKLVMPAHFEIAAIPRPEPLVVQAEALPSIELSEPLQALPPTMELPVEAAPTIDRWLWAQRIAFGGSLLFAILSILAAVRFSQRLRRRATPHAALQAQVDGLAAMLDVRTPRVRLVAATISPLLWGAPWKPTLMLPRELYARLSDAELESLLIHELTHLKRGDVWVRWFETIVLWICWWNPIAWWARAQLRRAEELACDARVLRARPQFRRSYADAIVKTLEFIAGQPAAPRLATGVDGTRRIKERLTMILNRSTPDWRRAALPLLVAILLALPVVPGFADRDSDSDDRDDRNDRQHREKVEELERREIDLERRFMELEEQREKLEMELQQMRLAREEVERQREVAELKRHGHEKEAAMRQQELDLMRAQVYEEQRQRAAMADHRRAVQDYEQALRQEMLALRAAEERNDADEIADREIAMAEYKRAMAMAMKEQHNAEREYDQQMMRLQIEELRMHLQQLEEEADRDDKSIQKEREMIERELIKLKSQVKTKTKTKSKVR